VRRRQRRGSGGTQRIGAGEAVQARLVMVSYSILMKQMLRRVCFVFGQSKVDGQGAAGIQRKEREKWLKTSTIGGP
jgi:hypothetical protein